MSQEAHQARAYSVFCSMISDQGCFNTTPLGWGNPQHQIHHYPFIHLGERDTRVKCLAEEHNINSFDVKYICMK